MADDIVKTETKAAPSETKKIKLLFRMQHDHNGKLYKPGDADFFTQEEADQIRALGTVTTVINPGVPSA